MISHRATARSDIGSAVDAAEGIVSHDRVAPFPSLALSTHRQSENPFRRPGVRFVGDVNSDAGGVCCYFNLDVLIGGIDGGGEPFQCRSVQRRCGYELFGSSASEYVGLRRA